MNASNLQLSNQLHYDFGMRSLKSILLAAGELKRKMPECSEDQLALKALVSVNLPKLAHSDIPLFLGIT
jgi:dynein heavy chain